MSPARRGFQAQRRRHRAERRERRPRVERAALGMLTAELEVVIGTKKRRDAVLFARFASATHCFQVTPS